MENGKQDVGVTTLFPHLTYCPQKGIIPLNLDGFSTLHPPQERTIPINIASSAGNILNMNLYLTKEDSSEEQIQIDIIADYSIGPVLFLHLFAVCVG
ncbi:hypothetical protein CEXT_231641 [Caerostris extrusa]|uniref:Uncharacterized protein n=1 Tax=Caerostris extrusa TaxID=172846 RepID=A0AAV4SFP6_CAEEX|nr:hypothetical protein CEXT_231641 [Caerostris extrusa]